MQCRKVRKLLLPYSDGELPQKQNEVLEIHLGTCESCREILEQFGNEREALRRDIPLRAPNGFVDEVVAAVQSVVVSQQGAQPFATLKASSLGSEVWRALWHRWRRYSPITAVVFLVIAIGTTCLNIYTPPPLSHPFIRGGRGDFSLPGITYNERQFYLQQHHSVAMYAKILDQWHHNMSGEDNIIYYPNFSFLLEKEKKSLNKRKEKFHEISGAVPREMRFQAFIVPKNQPNEKLPAQLPQTPPNLVDSHIIPKARVREFVDFPAAIPLWLNPGYLLQEIRYIEGHSVLHLVYTNGIDSVSLFEWAIDGDARYRPTKGLASRLRRDEGILMRDFREYLAYTQKSASVLVWQHGSLCFALVGSEQLPRLMRLVEEIQKQMKYVMRNA